MSRGKYLTNSELFDLIAKAKKGDNKARDRICSNFEGITGNVIKKMYRGIMSWDELMNESFFLIVDAIDSFPMKGYPKAYIKQAIHRGLRRAVTERGSHIRLPEQKSSEARDPTHGRKAPVILDVMHDGKADENAGDTRYDVNKRTAAPNAEKTALLKIQAKKVMENMKKLTPKQRAIAEKLFIDGCTPTETSLELGIARSTAVSYTHLTLPTKRIV